MHKKAEDVKGGSMNTWSSLSLYWPQHKYKWWSNADGWQEWSLSMPQSLLLNKSHPPGKRKPADIQDPLLIESEGQLTLGKE
jgi:hypothetical protein